MLSSEPPLQSSEANMHKTHPVLEAGIFKLLI